MGQPLFLSNSIIIASFLLLSSFCRMLKHLQLLFIRVSIPVRYFILTAVTTNTHPVIVVNTNELTR